jgi:hypothetical protein
MRLYESMHVWIHTDKTQTHINVFLPQKTHPEISDTYMHMCTCQVQHTGVCKIIAQRATVVCAPDDEISDTYMHMCTCQVQHT